MSPADSMALANSCKKQKQVEIQI